MQQNVVLGHVSDRNTVTNSVSLQSRLNNHENAFRSLTQVVYEVSRRDFLQRLITQKTILDNYILKTVKTPLGKCLHCISQEQYITNDSCQLQLCLAV